MAAELNLADALERIATAVPDRTAIVFGERQLTYTAFATRVRRLARYLETKGLGCFAERPHLAGHESGQHLMAQYMHNRPEYLEGMFGAYRARVAPFNVNFRYVAEELRFLLADARPRAIQFDAKFAPLLADVLPDRHDDLVLLQVDDGSGTALLAGAIDYEEALASVEPEPSAEPDPDDLYVLYTGGTTGMPKGVLWRQADIAVTAVGLVDRRGNREWDSLDELVAAVRPTPHRFLPCAPLIHGAAQWGALRSLAAGDTVVLPASGSFDPAEVWDTVAREHVTQLSMVGDAFGRALADEIEHHPRDASSLRTVISGGAALQSTVKARLLAAVPDLSILETIGSSETGIQGSSFARDNAGAGVRTFAAGERTLVLSEDRQHVLEAGHPGNGWLASRGRVPLGYLGDPEKTALSFPVVDGERLSVPGDRARLLADGQIELLGRDSVTINSGGEKIFAEEVEAAVLTHPDVTDAVVCGRPSERWGSEVVALVSLRDGAALDSQSILAACEKRLARYKLPKDIIAVPRIERGPAGKADYRWAQQHATNQTSRI